VSLVKALISLAVLACAVSACSSDDEPAAATDTCIAVCDHLATSCPDHVEPRDACLSKCEDERKSATTLGCEETFRSYLSCCSRATFTQAKCADEGVGELGFSDCNDGDICDDIADVVEKCHIP